MPDFLFYLRRAFLARKKRNPRYSLRAFARDLEVSASQLSLVLRRKRGFSLESAAEIALRLQLNEMERKQFLAGVEKDHARVRALRSSSGIVVADPPGKTGFKIRLRGRRPEEIVEIQQKLQNRLQRLALDFHDERPSAQPYCLGYRVESAPVPVKASRGKRTISNS